MDDVSPRYRGCRFRDIPQIGAALAVHLDRAREWARLRTRLPCTLRGPQPETDWNFLLAPHRTADHRPAGLLPCSGDKTGRKGVGVQQGTPRPDF
jgi:hypothetical protein